MRNSALIFGLVLMVTGCTSAPYDKPIAEFSKATDKADDSVEVFAKQLQDRERQRRLAFAESNPKQLVDIGVRKEDANKPLSELVETGAGCTSDDASCLLVLKDYHGGPVELEPGPQLENIKALMDEIQAYAANLKAVAEADTRQRVDGAIDAISGDVKEIAKLLNQSAPASISAVGDLAKWVGGAYLDSVKIDALRKATTSGEEAMGDTTEFLAAVADLLEAATRFDDFGQYSDARESVVLSDKPSRKQIEKWEATRQHFDRLLRMEGGSVFREMREAHHAIYEALQMPELNFETAIAQVKKYKKSVEELADILTNLQKSLSKEG